MCDFCKPVLAKTMSSKARKGPALVMQPWNEAQICPCKFCRPVYQIGNSAATAGSSDEFVDHSVTLADFLDVAGHTSLCRATEPRSALHWAAIKGHREIAQDLVCYGGATINAEDLLTGMTPLHMAAVRGHSDVADLLMDHGADVNEQDRDGCTAGYLAASYGNADMLKRIFNKGWEPSIPNDQGWTAVHAAASAGHANCLVQILNWSAHGDAKRSTATGDGKATRPF